MKIDDIHLGSNVGLNTANSDVDDIYYTIIIHSLHTLVDISNEHIGTRKEGFIKGTNKCHAVYSGYLKQS